MPRKDVCRLPDATQRARRLPLPRGGLVCFVAACLLGAGLLARTGAADAPPDQATRVDVALRHLGSPLLAERLGAVRALVDLLPGVRGRVIEALPGASWTMQMHLIEVLAHDRSDDSVQALLEHLTRAEATQAVLIQNTLARDPQAASRLLAAWRANPEAFLLRAGTTGLAPRRLASLVQLCRRAEIEARFLSRKSKSGSTGYYEGQYDLLQGTGLEKDFREHALAIAAGIALDEAIPTAGVYTSGVYRFVRTHHVDTWELKSMALHAVGELCTKADKAVILRLEERLVELVGERAQLLERMHERWTGRWASKPFQDALMEWDDALAEYLDHLACLHQIEPERYGPFVRRFVTELKGFRDPFAPLARWSYIAALLIRVGYYDEAITAFQYAMGRGSKAIGYYNMACAASGASKTVGLSERQKTRYLNDAVMYLNFAVEGGWSDIEWMNEDRDLAPVRKHRASGYARVIERIKRELHIPGIDPDEAPKKPAKKQARDGASKAVPKKGG